MNKLLSVLLLAGLTAVAQDDNRPGPVILQSPGTIAWPFPGVTLTVRPDTIIITNVLTLEISASASPITSFNINWTTNGPQPGTVNFSDIHSRTTQVTLSIAGTYNLLCVINDGPRFVATPFTVVANVVQNFAPTITPIANQSLDENHSTPAIPFTVGDDITAPGALSVNATSSNPALIDNTGIFLGGGGANRNITLVPKNQQAGTSTITVSVTDGSTPPMTTSISFLLTVSAVNQPPTFTSVPNPVNFSENVPGTFNVGIADPDTPLANLQLTATSTASFLSSLVVTGSGAVRTVNVLPVPNQYGTNTIILHLSDGQNQVSTTLGINVAAVNNPPVISVISPLQQLVGTPTTTAFYINDTEDGGNLTLSRSSDNLAVAPLANLVFGGAGTNRTITFTPAAVGVANVSVVVTDSGGLSATNTFTATGNAIPNTPPTITPPPNTTVWKNQPTGLLPVTVGDAETPVANLFVQASSDNPLLTPSSGITVGGAGANRTVSIVPANNQVGTATITVRVTDGGNLTTPGSFALTVSPTNYPPTISAISSPQTVAENSSISIPFTVGDPDTALASLVLSGVSSDPVVVPAPNITFSGTGANRTGKVQPATNKYGTNTVTFSVNDGTTTVSTNFTLQVTFVNQLPTITGLSNQGIATNSTVTQNITIGDVETPAANLTLTGSSSDTSIIANNDITFGGSGANRTVTVRSRNNGGGCTITVIVTDGNVPPGSRSQSFSVTVTGGGGTLTGYFVGAPDSTPPGNDGNSGTDQTHPWTLTKALSAGTVPSGKTVWMLAGDYQGTYRGAPNGITIRPVPGAEWWKQNHVVMDRNLGSCAIGFSDDNALIMMASWNHTTLRDVELRNSVPRCVIAEGQSTARPELIRNLNGTPHGNVIYHCFLRDGMNNLEWEIHNSGPGDTFRGNVSLFGGQGAHYEGGGMGGMWYLQNVMGGTPMRIEDNILGMGYNRIGELNGSSDGPQDNIIFDGNIAFGPGVMGCYRLGCSMGSGYLVCTANTNINITFNNNCLYNWLQNYPPIVNGNPVPYNPAISGGGAAFGKPNFSSLAHWNQVVSNNYICGSEAFTLINPRGSVFRNNTWIAGKYNAADLYNVTTNGNFWDGNRYFYPNDPGFPAFRGTKNWVDANEQITIGHPTVNKIIRKVLVDPNGGGPKIMNLAVFNWQRGTVQVDLSQDDYGTPFLAEQQNYTIICTLNPLVTYSNGTKQGVTTIPWTTNFQLLQPASIFYEDACAGGDGIAAGLPYGGGHPMTTFPDFAAFQIIAN